MRGAAPPLILGVGACSPDLCELDPELMRAAHVVADGEEAARVESGDVIRSGCQIAAEIGQVVREGKKQCRTFPSNLLPYDVFIRSLQEFGSFDTGRV